jgi:aminoglycoside phosphotransferase (APT) family kinase protein
LAPTVGAVVARGTRSTVRELGTDAVAKVPLPDTAEAWIRYEAEYSSAARLAGAPVPEFLGFIDHAGRTASVYRRARGQVMWEAIVDEPAAAASHGELLAELQRQLTTLVPPVTLPSFADRVRCKVRTAAPLVGIDATEVLSAEPAGGPIALCHGDLHPSNVVLTNDGPMIVDWFDAGRGDPLADVARSTLLMAPDADSAPSHLAGGDVPGLRRRLTDAYLSARGDLDLDRLSRWRAVMAVARLAEGVASAGLVEVWRAWYLVPNALRGSDPLISG